MHVCIQYTYYIVLHIYTPTSDILPGTVSTRYTEISIMPSIGNDISKNLQSNESFHGKAVARVNLTRGRRISCVCVRACLCACVRACVRVMYQTAGCIAIFEPSAISYDSYHSHQYQQQQQVSATAAAPAAALSYWRNTRTQLELAIRKTRGTDDA